MGFSFFKGHRIGIDIDSRIRILKDGEIVVNEPFSGIWSEDGGKLLYKGEDAERLFGEFPYMFNFVRPNWVNEADGEYFTSLLKKFINEACPGSFLKPEVLFAFSGKMSSCLPSKLKDLILRAGAGGVEVIYAPAAAALGAGRDISFPCGTLVVNMGESVADIALIAFGDVVLSRTLHIGGESFGAWVVQYIKNNYNIRISRASAEKMFQSLKEDGKESFEVLGRNLSKNGIPERIKVSVEEIQRAAEKPLERIGNALKDVMGECPKEFLKDICQFGVILTGSGSEVFCGEEKLGELAGVKCVRDKNPSESVIYGLGKYIEYSEMSENENV